MPGGYGRRCSLGPVVTSNLEELCPCGPLPILKKKKKKKFNYILQLQWYKDKHNPGWIHIILFTFFLLILKVKIKTFFAGPWSLQALIPLP